MTKYKFRTDLSKTRVCRIVLHVTGMEMPKLGEVEFRKNSGTYWLRFYSGDRYCKVTFSAFAGKAHIRVEEFDFGSDKYHQTAFYPVQFEYLQENGCLREAS